MTPTNKLHSPTYDRERDALESAILLLEMLLANAEVRNQCSDLFVRLYQALDKWYRFDISFQSKIREQRAP